MPETPPSQVSGGPDVKYLIVTGGLLVLIIVCLSVLWLMERNKRISAEVRLGQSLQRQGSLENILGRMLPERRGASIGLRDVVEKKVVNINGQKKTAVYVTPSAGRRLGLNAEEVLIIAPPVPSTQQDPGR